MQKGAMEKMQMRCVSRSVEGDDKLQDRQIIGVVVEGGGERESGNAERWRERIIVHFK